MFVNSQKSDSIKDYSRLLSILGSLSNLFSESEIPYLHYRVAENVFCKSFGAKNLSRSDCSADAMVNDLGIGIKTYLNNNGKTFQKIAEFNKERKNYEEIIKKPQNFVNHISNLRNKRIESTQAIHDIENLIYHCIVREKNKFLIYEENMDYVNINNISRIEKNGNSIFFKDNLNEYLFNISKSTLFKRFYTIRPIEIHVNILKDPYETLKILFDKYQFEFSKEKKNIEFVILPLYSSKTGEVEEKSGLNQWNAGGRKRKKDEVYIPIPIWIHRKFPNFFPLKDVVFNLHLPNKKIIKAKICQNMLMRINGKLIDKGKGLMSNPNTELGNWILRDILKAKEGKIITYKMLEDLGIDSVEVRKINRLNYEIDFKNLNSFQDFFEENQN